MSDLTLSAAISLIRSAREDVRSPGKFEGQDPWVAWLWSSNWAGCADYEVGSVDERGWGGIWLIDRSDLASPHRLFRELRDPGVTCVVVCETSSGFVHGWTETRDYSDVQADLDQEFGLCCDACGRSVEGESFEAPDYNNLVWCRACACVCEGCGNVCLNEDMHELSEEASGGDLWYCEDCALVCPACNSVGLAENMIDVTAGRREDGDFGCPECVVALADGRVVWRDEVSSDSVQSCVCCSPGLPALPADPIDAPAVDVSALELLRLLSPAVLDAVGADLIGVLIGSDLAAAQAAVPFAQAVHAVRRAGGAS